MTNYLDMIMTNKIFDDRTTDEWMSDVNIPNETQRHMHKNVGGNLIGGNQDKPTGGFPPIIIIDKERAIQKEASKNRELSNIVAGISIKDLLGKKKTL